MRWLVMLGYSPSQTGVPRLNLRDFSERMSAGPWAKEQGGHKALHCLSPGLGSVVQHCEASGLGGCLTVAAPSRITTVTGWQWEIPGAVRAPREHDPMQAELTHCPISPACPRLPTLPQDMGTLAALPDPHQCLLLPSESA